MTLEELNELLGDKTLEELIWEDLVLEFEELNDKRDKHIEDVIYQKFKTPDELAQRHSIDAL
jgi:hypothetical protein